MMQMPFYSETYEEIKNISWVENIILQYTVFNNKLSIKFDSWEEKYTILLQNGSVESIYKGVSKIASGNITLWDIKNSIN
jgi:hypothetical protein